jgi:hypothetical protein
VLGSIQYFPAVSNFELGGWLFTIGSAGFLIADLLEWWYFRVGCMFDSEYFHPNRHIPFFSRAEVGLNFFFSAIGSALYLIGSIDFIPSFNAIVEGSWIFIFGSSVIFLSQLWKVIRTLKTDPTDVSDLTMKLSNACVDLPAFGVDVFAGLGGLAYCIGSTMFLPHFDTNGAAEYHAAVVFVTGGTFFLLSGIFLAYRYFCTLNYPHDELP